MTPHLLGKGTTIQAQILKAEDKLQLQNTQNRYQVIGRAASGSQMLRFPQPKFNFCEYVLNKEWFKLNHGCVPDFQSSHCKDMLYKVIFLLPSLCSYSFQIVIHTVRRFSIMSRALQALNVGEQIGSVIFCGDGKCGRTRCGRTCTCHVN